MVEEAAGTSMYESKRDQTNKLIEKKDAKLSEMDAVSIYLKSVYIWTVDCVMISETIFFPVFFFSCSLIISFISISFPIIWLWLINRAIFRNVMCTAHRKLFFVNL